MRPLTFLRFYSLARARALALCFTRRSAVRRAVIGPTPPAVIGRRNPAELPSSGPEIRADEAGSRERLRTDGTAYVMLGCANAGGGTVGRAPGRCPGAGPERGRAVEGRLRLHPGRRRAG